MSDSLYSLNSYFYDLPEELIAQKPCLQREEARLMVINRRSQSIVHDSFANIAHYLPSKSALVVNNTRVIQARLLGRKADTGADVEVFLLKSVADDSFETLLRPLKKLKQGDLIEFDHGIRGELIDRDQRIVRFNRKDLIHDLEMVGHIPLPPYIKRPDTMEDREDYQTVYAKNLGSVASPTAGLHFTKTLIDDLKKQGHPFLELTLHINYGTFKPVETEDIRQHPMHTEQYALKEDIFKQIRQFKAQGTSVVAVGTTTCRVLESVVKTKELEGSTNIFIYPGHQFEMIDALITNFHLPYSTLLMLVCAFGGHGLIMKAYHEAIQERYRFYSYGDAMLIL